MPGLLTVKSNDEIDREAAEAAANMAQKVEEPVVSRIVGQIQQAWSRNKRGRMTIDTELLKCMRQRKGEYDPDDLALIQATGGGNTIFMMLTATKCAAAAAWISDVMLPPDDLPVGVEATPIADLPPVVYAELVQHVVMQAQQKVQQSGQQMTPGSIQDMIESVEADVKQRVNDVAKDRAEGMTKKLQDTMEQGALRNALGDFIEDFVTFPTAILKGPIYRKTSRVEWVDGWKPNVVQEITPEVERVSPFDIYPSPEATTCEDGELIERTRMTRKQLRDMMGRKNSGYDDEAIERVLRNFAEGRLSYWLWTDAERAELENKAAWWIETMGCVDALHYYGSAQGLALIEWGMSKDIDPLDEYNIEAILIGNECIRLVINDDPLGRRPYHSASFRRSPGSFWGESLPYLIRDTQSMCNSVARSLADNLGISSGPQVMINNDALADGENVTQIYPWKIWQMSYDMNSQGGGAPLNFYQPSSNASELLEVYAQFEQKADDESGVPRYTYGNEHVGGAGQTASGLSMLFDAAAKGLRKAIGNVDAGVMRPMVSMFWMDEMRFGDDQSIKGDSTIVARGASALLIKSQAQQRRQQFLESTNNPVDIQIIGLEGRAELLRANAQALDMDPDKIVPKREEISQRVAQQQAAQAAQAEQPTPAMINAKTQQAKVQLDAQKSQQNAELQAEKQQSEAQTHMAKIQSASQIAGAQLAAKEQEQDRRYKLDVARYLSGQEEQQFQRRMGLLVSHNSV